MKGLIAAAMEGITGVVYWPRPQLGGRDAPQTAVCSMFPFVERLNGTGIAYHSQNRLEALTTLRALHLTAETQKSG